jgi:hypothetical protein
MGVRACICVFWQARAWMCACALYVRACVKGGAAATLSRLGGRVPDALGDECQLQRINICSFFAFVAFRDNSLLLG